MEGLGGQVVQCAVHGSGLCEKRANNVCSLNQFGTSPICFKGWAKVFLGWANLGAGGGKRSPRGSGVPGASSETAVGCNVGGKPWRGPSASGGQGHF
jgi:hypothetical protein